MSISAHCSGSDGMSPSQTTRLHLHQGSRTCLQLNCPKLGCKHLVGKRAQDCHQNHRYQCHSTGLAHQGIGLPCHPLVCCIPTILVWVNVSKPNVEPSSFLPKACAIFIPVGDHETPLFCPQLLPLPVLVQPPGLGWLKESIDCPDATSKIKAVAPSLLYHPIPNIT